MAEDKQRQGPPSVKSPIERPGHRNEGEDTGAGISDIDYDPTIAGPDVEEARRRKRRGEPSADEVDRARDVADLVVGGRRRRKS